MYVKYLGSHRSNRNKLQNVKRAVKRKSRNSKNHRLQDVVALSVREGSGDGHCRLRVDDGWGNNIVPMRGVLAALGGIEMPRDYRSISTYCPYGIQRYSHIRD